MTKRKEWIEDVLYDLGAEPVQAEAEFKQRLITTLQQEQRNILQARTGWRQRLKDLFLPQAHSGWLRPAMRWAFVAALFLLAFVGMLIPWTLQRPRLTIHQGVAQVDSQQSLAPKSQQNPGDVISVAEGTHITLDEDSTASLLLFDDSKVELLAGTQLTLTTVQPRSMWQAQAVRLQMTTGQVHVQVSPLRSPDERFEVDLPAALISVRGTAFRAQVISPQHIYVATDEGVVAVMLHDPSQGNPLIEVPAGFQVNAIIGQPLRIHRQATSGNVAEDTTALLTEAEATRVPDEITPSPVLPPVRSVTTTPASRPGTTITIASKVTTTLPMTGMVSSGSTITGVPPDTQVGVVSPSDNPSDNRTPAVPPLVDLEVLQVDVPTLGAVEGVLTYTLLVVNHGPDNARNVVVHDVLAPQVYLVGATLPVLEKRDAQTATTTVEWELGTIAAGDRSTLQAIVAVHSWVTQSFTNTAIVTTTTLDENPYNNQATVETMLTDAADLEISAEIPPVIGTGSVVTCTLVYANFGPAVAHNVTIVERLAAEISFGGVVSAELWSPPYATAIESQTLEEQAPATWMASKLAAGAIGRIVFTATMQPGVLGPLTSTVVITSNSPDSDWNNNDYDQVTFAAPVANVAIAQSAAPDPVVAGGVLTYTLAYTNYGPWAAENVFVTLTLPVSVTLSSGVALAGHSLPDLEVLTQTGRTLAWFAPSLLPGASGTAVLTVTVDRRATGPLRSHAVIHSATLDGNPGDNTVAGAVDALRPALSLVQTVQPGAIAPHQPCTYTLRVTNTGAATFTAQSLSLVEMLPPGFRLVTITATQPVTPAQTWDWRNPAPLSPGDSFGVSLVVSASETISPGLYLSLAEITATVPGNPLTATASALVHLTSPSVAVAQQMTGDGANIATSKRVTLTIRLDNTGPSPLTAVPLMERYDPHILRFVGADPNPEIAPRDNTIRWGNLVQAPPHGIGRDLLPGKTLTVTLTFDVTQPLTSVNSVESYVSIGKLRDVYDNISDGYTVGGSVYEVRPLYLPMMIRSS